MTSRVPDAAELADDLARIEAAVERGARETRVAIEALSSRIESTYLRADVAELVHLRLGERMKVVEERHTWLARTAITALMLPIIVAIIVAIILTGGAR